MRPEEVTVARFSLIWQGMYNKSLKLIQIKIKKIKTRYEEY
jgi:hypothetical protein